jgi:hypothetical protein
MARKPSPSSRLDRKQPTYKERSNDADRSGTERSAREQRTGEGSDSALATLKHIERDRRRSWPADAGGAD